MNELLLEIDNTVVASSKDVKKQVQKMDTAKKADELKKHLLELANDDISILEKLTTIDEVSAHKFLVKSLESIKQNNLDVIAQVQFNSREKVKRHASEVIDVVEELFENTFESYICDIESLNESELSKRLKRLEYVADLHEELNLHGENKKKQTWNIKTVIQEHFKPLYVPYQPTDSNTTADNGLKGYIHSTSLLYDNHMLQYFRNFEKIVKLHCRVFEACVRDDILNEPQNSNILFLNIFNSCNSVVDVTSKAFFEFRKKNMSSYFVQLVAFCNRLEDIVKSNVEFPNKDDDIHKLLISLPFEQQTCHNYSELQKSTFDYWLKQIFEYKPKAKDEKITTKHLPHLNRLVGLPNEAYLHLNVLLRKKRGKMYPRLINSIDYLRQEKISSYLFNDGINPVKPPYFTEIDTNHEWLGCNRGRHLQNRLKDSENTTEIISDDLEEELLSESKFVFDDEILATKSLVAIMLFDSTKLRLLSYSANYDDLIYIFEKFSYYYLGYIVNTVNCFVEKMRNFSGNLKDYRLTNLEKNIKSQKQSQIQSQIPIYSINDFNLGLFFQTLKRAFILLELYHLAYVDTVEWLSKCTNENVPQKRARSYSTTFTSPRSTSPLIGSSNAGFDQDNESSNLLKIYQTTLFNASHSSNQQTNKLDEALQTFFDLITNYLNYVGLVYGDSQMYLRITNMSASKVAKKYVETISIVISIASTYLEQEMKPDFFSFLVFVVIHSFVKFMLDREISYSTVLMMDVELIRSAFFDTKILDEFDLKVPKQQLALFKEIITVYQFDNERLKSYFNEQRNRPISVFFLNYPDELDVYLSKSKAGNPNL
eukprot:TRINITY_DN3226_c6_g7_i1.p1 TRINITY_DN3226_c6_g7~~TRINITY_DN3226_c6_g7_i1.p1  ORF type:complete len:931 (+),score=251.63 TRINITY_DN3226_c6_g7_i1:322-2793(+)